MVSPSKRIIARFRGRVNAIFDLTGNAQGGGVDPQRVPEENGASFDKAWGRCYNLCGLLEMPLIGESDVKRHNLQRELEVAVDLAREAGRVILSFYRTGLPVAEKDRGEPVTEADRAADELISAGLRSYFPGDGLLTEESDDDLSRLDKERVWIVDPLDGTTEFITETGEFAVQIALTIRGQPVLGVVYQPVKDRLFTAVGGQGVYQLYEGQTDRLHVSTQENLDQMCLVASRSHYSKFIEEARKMLGIREVNRVGSVGLKVGLVVRGVCDLYLATTVAKEWDLCAPHALLLEAGGTLTNLCGEAIVYNKADVAECRGLIGSNGLVHSQIVEILAPLVEAAEG
jgi:3'(2'), 5'-bisphosphate nucleotidase